MKLYIYASPSIDGAINIYRDINVEFPFIHFKIGQIYHFKWKTKCYSKCDAMLRTTITLWPFYKIQHTIQECFDHKIWPIGPFKMSYNAQTWAHLMRLTRFYSPADRKWISFHFDCIVCKFTLSTNSIRWMNRKWPKVHTICYIYTTSN